MKYGKKLKLGDAHVTPRNIQEIQASKLGDAPRHPFFINKISGHLSIVTSQLFIKFWNKKNCFVCID
jgi:hypothetical protein